MERPLKRIRGALGVGATWAGLWSIAGLALALAIGIWRPDDIGAVFASGTVAVAWRKELAGGLPSELRPPQAKGGTAAGPAA